MKTLYQTQVTAEGGRAGHVRSADGTLDLALSLPRELGGAGGAATNPEQLFAAGYAACFENAVLHVARLKQVKLASTAVTATVGIGPREDGGFALTVALAATLGAWTRRRPKRLWPRRMACAPTRMPSVAILTFN